MMKAFSNINCIETMSAWISMFFRIQVNALMKMSTVIFTMYSQYAELV